MNVKTTLFLVTLLVLGIAGWFVFLAQKKAEPVSPTVAFLDGLSADKITRIVVAQGDKKFTLERPDGKAEWSLPGNWPVRQREVDQLVDTIASLRTRYSPISTGTSQQLTDAVTKNPFTVTVTVSGKAHTLAFGELPGVGNRFNQPTYMKLDDQKDLVRLAPGLIGELSKNDEYFRQRRLFAAQRVAKDDSLEKVNQVSAKEIHVKGPDGEYRVIKTGDQWEMTDPVGKDKVDADPLQKVLTSLPGLWAEKFVNASVKTPEEMGLKDPKYTISVTKPSGSTLKLRIGEVSRVDVRKVMKPGPPNQFGMPSEPKVDLIHDEYRYAQLEDNKQIFEVKGDLLKDIAIGAAGLRDPQVVRFKTGDIRRVEIKDSGKEIVLVKKDDQWKIEKPTALDAETSQVTELLDKLTGLRAKDKEIIDKADLKKLGLETPMATIKVDYEVGKDKEKKTETAVFFLGASEAEKGKLFVQLGGWPRVNSVEDALQKLVQRPALAYQKRRLLDLATSDLSKVEITRGGDAFAFEQKDGNWKQTQPSAVDVESSKVASLAGDLAKLDAVEFVTADPKKEDLDKVYGLEKPTLTAKFTSADAKKPGHVLVVGKQREDKDDYYARLDDGPIFALKKSVRDDLDRDSLAYRANQLWELKPDQIAAVGITRDGASYKVERDDKKWKLTGPFTATPLARLANEVAEELAGLKIEKFVAQKVKDFTEYGLDKPALKVTVTPEKDGKSQTLEIGKGGEKGRFAKLVGQDSVFIVGDKLYDALNRSALDLLDKDLLAVNPEQIEKIKIAGPQSFALSKVKDAWQVIDSPAPAFAAEKEQAQDLLRSVTDLAAEKLAAYGPKLDLASFGLDKPGLTITLSVREPGEKDKPGKVVDRVIQVGKDAGDGQRYVRVDQQEAVGILGKAAASELSKTYLDFLSTKALDFDFAAVTDVVRKMTDGDFEIQKKGDNWEIVKPATKQADTITLEQKILEKLFRLKAVRVAAYPAKDLKPFGLDTPTAEITIKSSEGGDHVIKIGKTADKSDERFALIDKQDKVFVLPAELSKLLTASTLNFGDRNLAFLSGADQVQLEKAGRKLTFSKEGGAWKVVEPIKTEAEDSDLDSFLRDLYRLRADEMVADKADPKKYGLDAPLAEWKLTRGGKQVLDLFVGAAEPGKSGRHFAKLAGSDLVFLLNPKTSSRALDEYRARTPWSSFDAAQVDRVTFQGGETFTLVKKDTTWLVPGKDAKIDAKKVSEALDALSRLKASRYVQDAKADLALYGLTPPLLTIEIGLPSGKRVLHVGRAEGDTKAYYASVPGSDAVFVIPEVEAAKIVRTLKGFE